MTTTYKQIQSENQNDHWSQFSPKHFVRFLILVGKVLLIIVFLLQGLLLSQYILLLFYLHFLLLVQVANPFTCS